MIVSYEVPEKYRSDFIGTDFDKVIEEILKLQSVLNLPKDVYLHIGFKLNEKV